MTKATRRLVLSVLVWWLMPLGGTGASMAATTSSTAPVGYAESLVVPYNGVATTASRPRNDCENGDHGGYDALLHVRMGVVEMRAWSDSLLAAKRVAASEKRAKSIAKRIERELGKDARRAFHDAKEAGMGDRTVQELLDDARSIYENAGKEIPKWLR